jgi:hypothetical protein
MDYKEARQAGMDIWAELMDQAEFNGAPSFDQWLKPTPDDQEDYDTTIVVTSVPRETQKGATV